MTYSEVGFRGIYQNFCVFKINEHNASYIKDFPGSDEADSFLAYGYIDHEAGMTLEVIACALETDDGTKYFDTNMECRSIIRIEEVMDDEYRLEMDVQGSIRERYDEKIAVLDAYKVNDEIEQSRTIPYLDDSRHDNNIDDVMVYLEKEENNSESCWVRIEGIKDGKFVGTLLNEPFQEFGYHKGDELTFFAKRTEDERVICISDMNEVMDATIEYAITRFNDNQDEASLRVLLEAIRNNTVWVPGTVKFSEADQKIYDQMVEESKKTGIAKEFIPKDKITLEPDILEAEGKYYFPIFTDAEQMGEYGNDFSKVEKNIIDVIRLARADEHELDGILINGFSESFILIKKLWDVIEEM